MATQQQHTQINVISGFLGAGKTTLLNRIIRESNDRKLAVLVNDLGRVNVDANEIERVVDKQSDAISGMMQLSNGCICCGVQNELWDALHELIVDYSPEQIVIEATGAAEPRQLIQNLYDYNVYRADIGKFIEVGNAITVVSAPVIFETIQKQAQNSVAPKRLLNVDPRRPIAELQYAQIECADVLLLNKLDLLPTETIKTLKQTLQGLNPRAKIIECRFAETDIEDLISQWRFDRRKSLNTSQWQISLENNRNLIKVEDPNPNSTPLIPEKVTHADYGISSFVYNARTPFDEIKFLSYLRNGVPGLLRAKGYYWTIQHPDQVGFLSICGEIQRLDYESVWWKYRVDNGEIPLDRLPQNVKSVWNPTHGDCRQEIVFIGIDIDQQAIIAALDECFAQ